MVDAPCGTGKTEWAISMMNENRNESYIFVTPYLDEIERVKCGTHATFYDPKPYHREYITPGEERVGRKTKLQDFNDLLYTGNNLCVTHKTFANADEDTIALLRGGNYHLIMDECMDVIVPFNNLCDSKDQMLNAGDVDFVTRERIVTADEFGRAHWNGADYRKYGKDGFKLAGLEHYADAGTLLLVDNTTFLWEFPIEVFNAVDDVTVLTYLFEGSYLKSYFDYHGVEYHKRSIEGTYGDYRLCQYHPYHDLRAKYKSLITICDDENLNNYSRNSLSVNWYKTYAKNKTANGAIEVRNDLRNYFEHKTNAKAADSMWTAPKDYMSNVSPKGYTRIRPLNSEERALSKVQQDKRKAELSCFVSSSAKATNKFSDRHTLAYMLNCCPHPYMAHYFEKKGISIDQDTYALSGLIQWVWRSAIRKGEPINLYLPHPRMRRLFNEWLNCER